MDLSQMMKQRRAELGITQLDLAEMSGLGICTIKDIERGKANPSLSTVIKILEVLGMVIRYEIRPTV